MNWIFNFIAKKPNSINVISSVLAIVMGLIFGLILMFIVNPSNALLGFWTILSGPLSDMRNMGFLIFYSTPIILTGLSVAFAFRTGLFNIGATGQLTVGAFFGLYVGVNWTFLGPFHWLVAILAAALGGAIWGGITGMLKAYRNVNEVVSSIMLNYVALYMVNLLILSTIYGGRSEAMRPASSAQLPVLFLDNLFPRSPINIGIFIALFVAAILHIILNYTTFGYELKSVGLSRSAAKYAGIKEKRSIVTSFLIAGAIAGIAGGIMYLVGDRTFRINEQLLEQGFTGIAIALLGLSSPIGVVLAGLFYGSILRGGDAAQRIFREEIIDIIIAVIIYFSALSLFTKQVISNMVRKRTKKEVEIAEKEGDVG